VRKATDFLHISHAAQGLDRIPELLGAAMRAQGVPYATAHKDETGHCLTCGQGLLCPGVHTLEEIQEAGRKALATKKGARP